MIWLAVAGGGALGSMARHGVNILFTHALPRAVPYATATVNLVGSVVIGLLAALVATGRLHLSPSAHVRVRRHPRRLHHVLELARHADVGTRRRSGARVLERHAADDGRPRGRVGRLSTRRRPWMTVESEI